LLSLAESIEANTTLRSDMKRCMSKERELENINQMIKDEHQALQLAFASLEDKLRKAQVHYLIIIFKKISFNF
jgi:autophagy-related protein 16